MREMKRDNTGQRSRPGPVEGLKTYVKEICLCSESNEELLKIRSKYMISSYFYL